MTKLIFDDDIKSRITKVMHAKYAMIPMILITLGYKSWMMNM